MRRPRASATWLSHDMAHALAAMCPPLQITDVVPAANELADYRSPSHVIGQLLHRQTDLMNVRRVVEALQALRDAKPLGRSTV
jgi:hypothetical protein